MKTITRKELIQALIRKANLSPDEAKRAMNLLVRNVETALIEEGQLKLSLFGTFNVRYKKSRCGYNFQTKGAAMVSARHVVQFKASKKLIDRLNAAPPKRQ
jgi:integration host factor subunit alpha